MNPTRTTLPTTVQILFCILKGRLYTGHSIEIVKCNIKFVSCFTKNTKTDR